jgi:hypothetical protein
MTDIIHDPVNSPSHYCKGEGIECIDAIDAAISDLSGSEAHYTATALAYLWRWRSKNGAQDLKKARWYLDRLIERVESR